MFEQVTLAASDDGYKLVPRVRLGALLSSATWEQASNTPDDWNPLDFDSTVGWDVPLPAGPMAVCTTWKPAARPST